MTFENIEGIIGKTFQFGYGSNSFTFSISADGVLTIEYNNEPGSSTPVEGEANNLPYVFPLRFNLKGGLDVGNARVRSSYNATENDELVNIAVLALKLNAFLTSAKAYTDQKVNEALSGGGGSTGGGGSAMLAPMEITQEQMTDGYSNIIGTLQANSFVDRIVFEVTEAFSKEDGSDYEISIGTITNPTALVPKFLTSSLTQTKVIDICRTLTDDTEYVIFVNAYTEPTPVDPFEQRVINNHESVVTSLTSDASAKIWTATFSGTNLEPSVLDVDDFGVVEGPYMDFGVNIPIDPTHQYRIVQQNAALQYYDGKDEFVSNQEGIWTKDKTYTFIDETEVVYNFLLTESSGDNDYAHIHVYDLSSDTPETAIRVYHIKNELAFTDSTPAASPLEIDFLSASEGTAGVVQNDENTFTITLSGEVTSKTAELTSKFTGLTKRATSLAVFYPKTISTTGIRTIIYNPGTDGMSDIQTASGINYTDVTYTPDAEQEGAWIEFPVTEEQSYPVVVMVIDLTTNDYMLIGVDNTLTYKDPPTEEEEAEPALMSIGRETLSMVAPLAAGDSGRMLLRIISF